jgi:membrane-bound lytic murein transglycosylase MltF
MQVKPSTAADKNINVPDINILENNIHAGAKYMRFIADRYFSEGMDDINRWFFSLAAYNAGPAKVARLRSEAEKNGLDPNRWFDNVEIIAARRIGRETIGYVANIYKHYVGYKMAMIRLQEEVSRHGGELKGCQAG